MPDEWNQRPEVGRHLDVLADTLAAPVVTDEMVERVWGHYSHPGDDATQEEELAAMRAALTAAFNTKDRPEGDQ